MRNVNIPQNKWALLGVLSEISLISVRQIILSSIGTQLACIYVSNMLAAGCSVSSV